MNSKTCSVIIPIYNATPFLAQCLSSIRMQTYQDLQVILVNDGSTDNSAAIAQSFVDADKRFSLLQQTNHGQSAARNRGLEIASGEYIVFVDADDYIDADFIEKHVAKIGSADYVQSGYRRVSTDGEILEKKLPAHRYQFTSSCMRLYRTSWIKQHGLSFPDGMIYEDVIFSLILWGIHPRCKMLKYIGYNYMFNSHSTTSHVHYHAQKQLYSTIVSIDSPWWIKQLTILRLKMHFVCV